MISKKDITNKIINTKIHTIGKQDIIMNKYKFSEELSNVSKSAKQNFLIDEKLNQLIDFLNNAKGIDIILKQKNLQLLQRNNEEIIDNGLIKENIKDYFSFEMAFTNNKRSEFESKISEIISEINAIEFAKEIVQIKKSQSIKILNLKSAIKYNDNIAKLEANVSKLKEKLKGIVLQIRIIEDEFIDDFNRLVLDVNENVIQKDTLRSTIISEYSKEVVEEYEILSIVEMIKNIFEGVEVERVYEIVCESDKLLSLLKDYKDEVLKRLNYVGANI